MSQILVFMIVYLKTFLLSQYTAGKDCKNCWSTSHSWISGFYNIGRSLLNGVHGIES